MSKSIVSQCPRCNEELLASNLSCNSCDLELNGDFPLSKFDYLSIEERDLIESFLRAQGNFKALQNEKGMSYQTLKKRFHDILDKLNLSPIKREEISGTADKIVNYLPINEGDSLVVRRIKGKLNKNSGRASIPLYRGDLCDIGFDSSGNGLFSSKIPVPNHLTWKVLDAAVEVVIKNGGKAMKGMARSGAKLGSSELPIDSVEGYIAHKVHGIQIGETAFGPGFVIAAILDWAGICRNERGYVTLNHTFLKEIE
ncbi:DUF2089 family protein [Bacillus infantis]|uniref:DUF2089 family protein n=1 Tax=Bacillus infantis TaxID=324767 RepID=UPI0030180697